MTCEDDKVVLTDFQAKKLTALEQIRSRKFLAAFQSIRDLVVMAEEEEEEETYFRTSRKVDQALQRFTSEAFVAPYEGAAARRRIMLGMDAVALQLSSNLAPPYDTVPKRVYLNALRALTVMNEMQQSAGYGGNATTSLGADSTYSPFRILQRLVTGVGIRRKEAGSCTAYSNESIQEKDFNMVLNSFSNMGRMDMAHKIVALQERTENAPPLSPVGYSILVKGYGRRGDLRNVDMIVAHAKANGIVPDRIMLNSLIDAYVNCNAMDKAKTLFDCMAKGGSSSHRGTLKWVRNPDSGEVPRPNQRTYNTILKGLAKSGSLKEVLSMSQKMEMKRLWDDVTTNTLVHAAVLNGNFDLAEAVLDRHTSSANARANRGRRRNEHPNVEAYTELLDGYSKASQLNNALQVMQTMKDRGVEPNEFTYTCLIAAFARHGQVDKAKKTIRYMTTTGGLKPTAVTYNAFISALLSLPEGQQDERDDDQCSRAVLPAPTDDQVDEAIGIFYDMMRSGIRPNDVTLATLIIALGRCRPAPRIEEAKELVGKLEKNGIVSYKNNHKVVTALVQSCGLSGDINGALDWFRMLKRPDLVAVNAFLDACCRCGYEDVAMKTFRHFFGPGDGGSSAILQPSVISFSILIRALLKKDTVPASEDAQILYIEMKDAQKLFPDQAMVDLVLKTVIRTGKLQKKDVPLVASIVRDAKELEWRPGQLERRRRAIKAVLSSRSRLLSVWNDEDDDILLREIKSEDTLLKRKGWNKVDSGFRLWGGGKMDIQVEGENDRPVDEFLESKGWNDMESGFRIF
ncbi:Pentatricopeptide repeat-containing protein [Seminavis robusta]|uniref:Pentatricopeptide repeat-containing protein n=1 Tax=Seminavis robusta TaxID=568900 RepID=A0A9N8HTI5_9STRA|nr:Pentatricopeptide repeat-containing protein [Seminavis robusta]|eukprot:Sro1595_g284660.1 Pentatricopeptide repeat-containing protein (798) ;mRNA; f:4264-6751